MAIYIVVDSKSALIAAHKKLDDNFAQYGYSRYEERHGESATLPMNSLLHLWLTQFAADLSGCHKKQVTKGMLDGIKRTMKGCFYRETSQPWMVHEIKCPLSGRSRMDYTSSADWLKGEKLMFMNWLQVFAAEKGTILESRGEHAESVQKQNI